MSWSGSCRSRSGFASPPPIARPDRRRSRAFARSCSALSPARRTAAASTGGGRRGDESSPALGERVAGAQRRPGEGLQTRWPHPPPHPNPLPRWADGGEGISLYTRSAMSETEPHLLVVDDDRRLRELLRRYLSDSGFRVTGAADAAEARAQLASFAFDLVVLDVMMPGESGIELTRALRQRAAPHVPVLLLTAMGEPEDRVNGLEQGADDYLAKPFEPRELVLRIRNILQRRPEPAGAEGMVRFGAFRFDW